MNTIKNLAKNWWCNELSESIINQSITYRYYKNRDWETLSDEEIENIFYNEVIIKWFHNDYYNTLVTPEAGYKANLMTADDIISLYLKEHSKPKKVLREINIDVSFELSKEREEEIDNLMKEHSKEEPALDFKYCKNEIEGGNKCYVQCDHCKEYYAPLEMEQPLSVNYYSSNLVTEKKEAIEFADYLLGNYEMAEFEKEHLKYVVDDELCWQLAGTQQKYTSVEMYQIWLNEPKISQPKDVILGYKTSLDAQMLDKIEPKQETTLEETAFRLFPRLINDPYNPMEDDNKEYRDIWISGAKWQEQRMYSEEDMISFAEFVATYPDKNRNVYGEMLHSKSKYDEAERTIDLLEQFKKK